MIGKFNLVTLLIFILMSVLPSLGIPAPTLSEKKTETKFSVTPVQKSGGKWRIGYLEGGDYGEYHRTLDATIRSLMDLGWIEHQNLPSLEDSSSQALWEFYGKNLKSQFLEFAPDAFYSAAWDNEKRENLKKELINRVNTTKDLDLVIAMGTWAGIDLAQGNHTTPTIVMAVNDALASGIIKSIHDSGNDYIHARVDPHRYDRQIQIFQTIMGFKTLGMIYRNDVAGRSYAAVDKVKKVARERGFTIQNCFLKDSANQEDDEEDFIQCFTELSKKVEAIYVTSQKAVNDRTVPIMAEIAKKAKIPTFSQAGIEEVRQGLLMSISQAGFKYVGAFYASTMGKILNGALPRELNQIFEDPSKIAINLTTAETIKFYPSMDVLSSADEIFQQKDHGSKAQ